jgi:hypothetical protein
MIDVREDVLVRLVELAGTIPTIRIAERNNPRIDEEYLPAAIIFDGDEETDDVTDTSARPPYRPTAVRMRPAIEIADMSGQVGSDLSALRRELIKLVLYDSELNQQIVKTTDASGRPGNGAIRYLGCQTDLQWMRSLNGVLRVEFLFKYWLNPADL